MYYWGYQLVGGGRSIAEGPSVHFLQAFEYDVAVTRDGQMVLVFAPEDSVKSENLYYMIGTLSS